jgi:hypothetical protein
VIEMNVTFPEVVVLVIIVCGNCKVEPSALMQQVSGEKIRPLFPRSIPSVSIHTRRPTLESMVVET